MDDDTPRSVAKIASVLKRDRATVTKALVDVPPAGRHAGHPQWTVNAARDALRAWDEKVAAQRAVNVNASGGDSPADDDNDQAAFRQHRAEFMRQKAIAATRKNEIEAAKWIKAQDTFDALSVVIVTARAKLLSLPNKVAARVMGRPAVEVAGIVRDEIHDILEDMATAPWPFEISGTVQFRNPDTGVVETRPATLGKRGLAIDGQ